MAKLQNVIFIIVTIFLATLISTILANFLARNRAPKEIDLQDKITRLSTEALRQNSEQFLTTAKEILASQKNEIRIDLDGKKTAIVELINEIRRDIKKNEDRIAKSDQDNLRSFSTLANELKSYREITGDLKLSTDRLKELLSNNQMRGAFGEQIAEDLLKMAGFVVGQSYIRNETQDSHATRPDFTILLPDQTKVNVDVKFPYSALIKYSEASVRQERQKFLVEFKKDVRDKIRQVCTREYVNPEDKTVDFVVLFIPNEMIFSFIYDKMNDVWEEAMHKKVILAGPFSFTAILRMVKQAYTSFRYQENLHHIISLIQRFDVEYQKYSESVDKLGERIKSTSDQFDVVSSTRDKKLGTIIDKIKSQNIIEADDTPQLLDIRKDQY